MKNPRLLCGALLAASLLLTGCWDYRSMDQINIVAGVAVDRAEDGQYRLTLEIVNVSAMKDGDGAETLLVSAQGPSLFEAVRNSKKKLFNKLYFGSMRTVIIGRDVAGEEGVLSLIDSLLRDVEPRETVCLVVSQAESAETLISAKGLDTTNVSFEIAEIIDEDKKIDSSSKKVMLYEAYNLIAAKGVELVLPAFRLVENNGEDAAEINGIAVFRGDRLAGYLSPEETHSYLLATDDQTDGVLTFPYGEEDPSLVALEIRSCRNKPAVSYGEDRVTIAVTVELDLGVIEFPSHILVSADSLEQVKSRAEAHVEEEIRAVFRKCQEELAADIYGYGNMVYEDQYPLWLEIGDRWQELFEAAEYRVDVKAEITNIGLTS